MSEEASQPIVDLGYTDRYFFMPRRLRADVAPLVGNVQKLLDFLVEQTFGWHDRWVELTYDEIINGRKKANGERLCAGSGIASDSAVRRAIKDALEHHLIEIRHTYGGTAYAVHRHYWASTHVTPRWELFGRISYDPNTDPLIEQPATIIEAQQYKGMPTTNSRATNLEATCYQKRSNLLSNKEQPTTNMVAEKSGAASQGEVRDEPRDTSRDTIKEIQKRDTSGADAPGSPAARPISVSKTEKEENEAPPAPAFSLGEQAPLRAKEDSKSNATSQGRKEAPAPAHTAEFEAARQRQRAAIDARRQAQEVERKATLAAERIASAAKEEEHRAVGKLQERYDALVLAKQKTEPGSPAWQQAQEELQEVKHQLAAYGWYL